MKNEKKFYGSLQKIFVGAPLEGEGGYVNLLKIKEKYYSKVISNLKKEIDEDKVITESFKENFYDMLFNFFEKYFNECGSVYFAKTANWQRVYEKVYNDNKDVVLFWKTHMLYYVKSDILFQNIYVKSFDETDNLNYVFYFDVGTLKQKQNNEKKELVFTFKEIKIGKVNDVHDETTGDKTFVLSVGYSERNKRTDIVSISSLLGIKTEVINKAINVFKKQTTIDFFINKNAKIFLEEQLDLFLNQYLLDDTMFNQERLNQIKAVKKYAKNIISFISQFESELVRIWNKPKFVKNSNYVITLNKVSDINKQKIIKHNNFDLQLKEWLQLGMIKKDFNISKIDTSQYSHLPIDTKYFKDIELNIIKDFKNIDEELNGRLIKSENYQALNTLRIRYKNSIKSIYIDPPFNTGNDFEYLDEYQDSSWLSIMNDRLSIAHELLKGNGSIFVHLDHFAEHRGRELLDSIFEKKNFINNLAWAYRSGGASDSKTLPYKHDSILFYSKNKDNFSLHPIHERQYYQKNFMGAKKDSDGQYYTDTLMRDVFEGEFFDPIDNTVYNVRKVLNLSDEFYAFKNSQKPEGLLRVLLTLSNLAKNEFVMDFFAGSGPTLAVATKMGNKFIGVEMGEHFNTFYQDQISYKNSDSNKHDIYEDFDVVDLKETEKKLIATVNKVGLLGRMKEVISCSGRHEPCGISDIVNWQGGGFFKYYELEQYEDTLNKASYSTDIDSLFTNDIFNQYVFFADDKFANVLKIKENGDFELNFDNLYENIDFPETISLLYGKPIEKIDEDYVKLVDIKDPIKYNVSKMNNEEKLNFVKLLKPLLWWGE